MAFLRSFTLFASILIYAAWGMSQQPADNQALFTISVASPTKARDVQVRYTYMGDSGPFQSSVATPTEDNKILIKAGAESQSAKSFRLVGYAPGCQLVTISVDDLSANHQGKFQCSALNTVTFNGHVDVSAINGRPLQVQVLYNCDWCPQFFGITQGALSPLVLGKADVASDGSFVFEMPDFSADPLWSTIANAATLSFLALDADTGQPFSQLRSQSGTSKQGIVPVAEFYSTIEFRLLRVDDRLVN